MSTLIGDRRDHHWRAVAKGLVWGVGHALTLVVLGLLLLVLEGRVPGVWERMFEAGVGLLLVCLGVHRLRDARRGPHLHAHRHADLEHAHYHVHAVRLDHGTAGAHNRHSHAPLWIGLLHGLAGTAALMALLPAVIVDSAAAYLWYILAFGFGSTLAMAAFCGGVHRLVAGRGDTSHRAGRWWAGSTGSLSLGVGVVWLATALAG